jgi:hypothetical protein
VLSGINRQQTSVVVVDFVYWLVIIVVVAALWFMGAIRPTGLLGRTRAEHEKKRQQDAAARFLKKDSE